MEIDLTLKNENLEVKNFLVREKTEKIPASYFPPHKRKKYKKLWKLAKLAIKNFGIFLLKRKSDSVAFQFVASRILARDDSATVFIGSRESMVQITRLEGGNMWTQYPNKVYPDEMFLIWVQLPSKK